MKDDQQSLKTVPEIIRAAMEADPDTFWRKGTEGLYGLVQFGKTTYGFTGTVHQVIVMNAVLDRADDDRRYLDIRLAPPLEHSQRKP